MTPCGRKSGSGSSLRFLWHRDGVRFFWLNFHLPYACRHSGACCTAGWRIPIEPERAALITPGGWLAEGGVLPRDEHGVCVFHNGRCAVYEHRPLSCVHFPYVCLIDARGVRVTLSHYCPTAASPLFEHTGPIEIVEGPSPVPALEMPEGLDARESLPPLAESSHPHAPGPRVMSWDEFSEWERHELRTLNSMAGESELAPVIERFLAAKLFASWAAYQGDGITAVRHAVRAAHAVLQEEMTRAAQDAGRSIDAALLKQAIRQADLRLVHAVTAAPPAHPNERA
jgi:Fe-S-cluster containining protein